MVSNRDPWDQGLTAAVDNSPAYGNPASAETLKDILTEERGETIVVTVHRNNDLEIKPKRGPPEVTEANFFSSVVNVDGRWVFSGVLNGWAAFHTLEILSVESLNRRQTGMRKTKRVDRIWNSQVDVEKPSMGENTGASVQVVCQMPSWSLKGYSKESSGFLWWYSALDKKGPRVSHGENIVTAAANDEFADSKAVRVHHWGHRYAKLVESRKDRLVYHTGVLIEWDHGQFTTLVELAWKHGIGGYGGKSNWVEDKMSGAPVLLQCFPACMIQPYHEEQSEIRMIDMPCKNKQEFVDYLRKYTGKELRFLNPKVKTSKNVKQEACTRADIARYLHNRIMWNSNYSEPTTMPPSSGHNCQTFAANFFGFMSKTREKCFSKVMAVLFTPNHKPFTKTP
mmetsp:Transcript_5994/g.7276  ORF Transcript_5994/g.7276 Transcript_5994/m.7276 type:complete len:396 (+) Transcript_5994:274-1461(+)